MVGKSRVIILGAGPAGLGAAMQLVNRNIAQVTVLEQNSWVGGNASSFDLSGMRVDFGSHRLHPASDPEILEDIRRMLGKDLLDRPRHGRIRLRKRWIHFPLKPLDLALRLPPGFIIGVVSDMIGKTFRIGAAKNEHESFATVMEGGLGRTICRDFYFPYARKIWGLEPEEMSVVQARRRVSNNSLTKMARKIISAIPGLKPTGSGRFFYPKNGFGQISESYYHFAQEGGAEICLNAQVESVEIGENGKIRVLFNKDGRSHTLQGDHVWSTIPITILAKIITPSPSQDTMIAVQELNTRAMILIYLVLAQDRFSEFDAHYFPEQDIPITRLSEPKIYRNGYGPKNLTVLCAELPCSQESPEWILSDEDLGELASNALERAGIPIKVPVKEIHVRRLRHAYPIYRQGYETYFDHLDAWVDQLDGVLSFGRQGLFAHDNTHHALFMAYSAVKCLKNDGTFDKSRWQEFRKIFETHVVED